METLAVRNNNPGNLRNTQTGGFQKFNDPVEGKAALYNDLTAKMTGKSKTGLNGDSTLIEFSQKYAPDSDKNDSLQYAANLANKLGVSPDTKIGTLSSRIDDFALAVASNEDPSVKYVQSGNNTPAPVTQVPIIKSDNQNTQEQQQGIPEKILDYTGGNKVAQAIGAGVARRGVMNNTMNAPEADYSKLSPRALAKLKKTGVPTSVEEQRKQTASQIEKPSTGEVITDAGKLGMTVGSLYGAGKLLSGVSKATSLLESNASKKVIQKAITGTSESVVWDSLTPSEKYNTLIKAYKNSDPATQLHLDKIIPKLQAIVEKEGPRTLGQKYGGLIKAGKYLGKSAGGLLKTAGILELGAHWKDIKDKILPK